MPKVDHKRAEATAKEILDSSMRSTDLQNLCLAYLELGSSSWPSAAEGGALVANELLEIMKSGLYAVPEGQRSEKTRMAITVLNMLLDYNSSMDERLQRIQLLFQQWAKANAGRTLA